MPARGVKIYGIDNYSARSPLRRMRTPAPFGAALSSKRCSTITRSMRISWRAKVAAGQPLAPAEKGRKLPAARAAWLPLAKRSGCGASLGGRQWRGSWWRLDGEMTRHVPAGSHWEPSEAISSHLNQPEAVSGHQKQSEAIRSSRITR